MPAPFLHQALNALGSRCRACLDAHTSGANRNVHIALIALTLLLAFLPLFNLLGYEFSLAIAVAISLSTGPLVISHLHRTPTPASITPAHAFANLCRHHAIFLFPPWAIISLNAIRVTNCDYLAGLAFYLFIPGLTLPFAIVLAMTLAVALPQRRRLAISTYFLVFFLSLAGAAAFLLSEPPIVVVNPFFGYFAGSIYDEALRIPIPLMAYRAALCAVVLFAIAAFELRFHWQVKQRLAAGWLTLAILSALATALLVSYSQPLGISINRRAVQQQLGAATQTQHFTIYHSAAPEWREKATAMAEDHDFRYHQLAAFFGNQPPATPVQVYVYPDRDTKAHLMGARNTLVAKLWLGEMHILYHHYAASVVKHELAHVFSADFGSGPLRLSARWGIFPQMAWVEGMAVAAEWPATELTPHGWAAAMLALEIAPPLTELIETRAFWGTHSRTAYTLMGSFVRWLIDDQGIDKAKAVYRGQPFAEVYHRSVEDAVAAWETEMRRHPLSPRELEVARLTFDRPPIFAKKCARSLADKSIQAQQWARQGHYERALDLALEVHHYDRQVPEYQQGVLDVLLLAQRLPEALAWTERILDAEKLGRAATATLEEVQADLMWQLGRREEAALRYAALLQRPALPLDRLRGIQIKAYALADPRLHLPVGYYFFKNTNTAARLARLWGALDDHPDPVLAYLCGLLTAQLDQHEIALTWLQRALAGELPSPEIAENARFILAESRYFTLDLDGARSDFHHLSHHAQSSGARARALDWEERVAWKQARLLDANALDSNPAAPLKGELNTGNR